MPEFRLGRHINTSSTFVATPWYAKSLGYNIFQLFLCVPYRTSVSKNKQDEQLIKFGEELVKRNMILVVHGSYTINLCHPANSTKFKASIKLLIHDLNSIALIGNNCLGVVIHMGKNIPANALSDDAALNNYVVGIQTALAATPPSTNIILETGASQGSEIGSKIDPLAEIYHKLTKSQQNRITFCIDTCHIWATGYDISNPAGVKKFFAEFDDKIGINKISCIHFNDSRTPLNSHVDRHADLTYGHIGVAGLKAIAQFAKKNNIPLITETPLDAVNPKTNKDVTFEEEIATVKSWLK